MSSFRLWLFRGLVITTAALVVISFTMPWWTADVTVEYTIKNAVRIYGYGLRHSLVELRPYIAADETPFYQTVLAWVYIAASTGLILFSTWLKGRKGRWLLGVTGLIYIAYAAIAAFVVIANRLVDFDISLQGSTYLDDVADINVYASLRFGYYLAYAAGLMCLALALLRDKIIGRPKLSA